MLLYPICIPSSLTCMCAQLLSHFWLCDPMDCSPPGSSVCGILWTIYRILQATFQEYWIGLPFPIPGHSQWALICCAKSSLSLGPFLRKMFCSLHSDFNTFYQAATTILGQMLSSNCLQTYLLGLSPNGIPFPSFLSVDNQQSDVLPSHGKHTPDSACMLTAHRGP